MLLFGESLGRVRVVPAGNLGTDGELGALGVLG